MQRKSAIGVAAGVAAIAIAVLAWFTGLQQKEVASAVISPANQALVARGKTVYANHCAACHGAVLEGQANWRERMPNGRLPAPPHDKSGHTWHHPDAVLVDITKNGLVPGRTAPDGYVSDMPAFGNVLSDEDIVATLAYIKSTWPPEVLEMQRQMTLQHLEQHRQ